MNKNVTNDTAKKDAENKDSNEIVVAEKNSIAGKLKNTAKKIGSGAKKFVPYVIGAAIGGAATFVGLAIAGSKADMDSEDPESEAFDDTIPVEVE